MGVMFYKRIIPVMLLAWMPFLSAHAAGEGVVNFKNTLGTIVLHYRQGDYEQAVDQIQLARQRPLGTSELVTLSLYEGIVLFHLGRHVESGDAFLMALLIRPDAKLPEQVAPKIAIYFETLRQRVQQELDSPVEVRPVPNPPPSSGPGSSECPPSRIAANGRTLKAQQLWRLASMERMLCVRGLRNGEMVEVLAALRTRVSEAGAPTEWIRIIQELDRISHEFAVYPSNDDWLQAKSLVPPDKWEVGDEDQDALLPEAPVVSNSPPEEEPANLFGCRAAVASECERLMRRLLLLQNQIPGLDAATKNPARKELFRLGQRVRTASSSEALEEASHEVDAWPAKWHTSDIAAPPGKGAAVLTAPPPG